MWAEWIAWGNLQNVVGGARGREMPRGVPGGVERSRRSGGLGNQVDGRGDANLDRLTG